MNDIRPTDNIISFAIPTRNCRGRVVRLGPALDQILASHAYPPMIRDVLAEAVCLTAMLGALLKDEGAQLTMQAQTEAGVINLLACDYKDGALRGYIDFDRERLEGASLAEAVQNYFFQSEQIPTLIRVAIGGSDDRISVGGLLVQHLPEGEEGRERLHAQMDHPEWEHVEIMAGTVTPAELTDPQLPLEDILWRLFSESDEVRVLDGKACVKGCRCNEDHIRDVIARFPKEDKEDMVDDEGNIAINCAFCSKTFLITGASLNN